MKIIVAGSRSITSRRVVSEAIEKSGWRFELTELVCGGAPGVDTVAHDLCFDCYIPIRMYLADWKTYPRGAGRHRNLAMAQYADALVAVWDGKSPGTKHMIETARRMGLQVYVEIVK